MSAAHPLVSFVFPVFNSAGTLTGSLNSILAQTHENIEVICVDDGSRDNSLSLLRQFANEDPRVRVIHQENRGLGGARNTGIRAAEGEWVAFVDSDDLVSPTLVSTLLSAAEADPRIDLVDGLHALLNGHGRVLSTRTPPPEGADLFALVFAANYTPMACARLYRRTLFDVSANLFPEHTIYEDTYTTYKLFSAARRSVSVPEVVYHWIERLWSLSRTMSRKHVDDAVGAIDAGREYLQQRGLFQRYETAFYCRAANYLLNVMDKLRRYESLEGSGYLRRYLHDWIVDSELADEIDKHLRDKHMPLLQRWRKQWKELREYAKTDDPGLVGPDGIDLVFARGWS